MTSPRVLHSPPALQHQPPFPVSRGRSPHFSPDRITRHASPARPVDPSEIILGIPQPYRTSFSAVTPPTRISRSSEGDDAQFSRGGPVRATLPCKFSPPSRVTKSHDMLLDRKSPPVTTKSHEVLVDKSPCSVSRPTPRVTISSESILDEGKNSSGHFKRSNVLYASTPSHIYGNRSRKNYKSTVSADDVFADDVSVSSQDRLVREFMGMTPERQNAGGMPPEEPAVRDQPDEGPRIKKLITKEYVHHTNVTYSELHHKCLNSDLPAASAKSDQIVIELLRQRGLLPPLEPIEPTQEVKCNTLPKDRRKAKSSGSGREVKRSLSTSISNFLRKMSPKSLRKPRPKEAPSEVSDGNSSQEALHEAYSAQTPPTLPMESARMLKSIGHMNGDDNAVYRSFKKQHRSQHSPHVEAVSLRPQALKAVEFPDSTLSPSAADSSKPSQRRGQPPPPKSLNVRHVAEMDKAVFKFPNYSLESIGQCSLDVHPRTGSEPSLTAKGLAGGAAGNGSVSKCTLVSNSQENMVVVASSDNRLQSGTSSGLRERSYDRSSDSLDQVKSPSYVKLSCVVSGYNKYTTPPSVRAAKAPGIASPVSNGQVRGQKPPPPVKPAPLRGGACRTDGSSDASAAVAPTANGPATSNGLDETDRCIVNHNAVENGPLTQDGDQLLQTPVKNGVLSSSDEDIPTPQKDGNYYLSVVQRETDHFHGLCTQAEQDLEQSDLSEEAAGKLRAVIGKANLLTSKKFKQFRGLCQQNIDQAESEPFQTTCQDLAGFWDMVLIQVEELNDKFHEIERLRTNGWISRNSSTASLSNLGSPQKTTPARQLSGTSGKSKSSRGKTASSSTPKSSKASEAARQREEARKRLLEAKRAGRQRKVSQSDKEEVEIFVPQ